MAEIRLYPFAKSSAFVERAAEAIASLPSDPGAWNAFHDPLALKLLDRGVTDERIGIELVMLRDRAARIAAQRAAAPARKAERRLRLVPRAQLDLFAPNAEPAIAKLEGEMAGGER